VSGRAPGYAQLAYLPLRCREAPLSFDIGGRAWSASLSTPEKCFHAGRSRFEKPGLLWSSSLGRQKTRVYVTKRLGTLSYRIRSSIATGKRQGGDPWPPSLD